MRTQARLQEQLHQLNQCMESKGIKLNPRVLEDIDSGEDSMDLHNKTLKSIKGKEKRQSLEDRMIELREGYITNKTKN